ncbi:MAG: hypothetical protein KA536_06440 [Saprospiraceae bacterium]|nr:hypothetical protein [Saprospiraceae bacterium]
MIKFKKLIIFLCLLWAGHLFGDTIDTAIVNSPVLPVDGSKLYAEPSIGVTLQPNGYRFDDLDKQIEAQVQSLANSYLSPPPGENQDPTFESTLLVKLGKAKLSNKVKRAQGIIDEAINIGRYVDKLTGGDIESLPIIKKQKIGNTDIYIVFQSAKIYPDFAEIEVYIKIDMKRENFDGSPAILYFGAKDIRFSKEKGIISGSVGLLADYCIKLAETTDKVVTSVLWLKAMEKGAQTEGQSTASRADDVYSYTGTYINFDCDGFKEMGVGGRVFFSRNWIIPVDESGNIRSSNETDQDEIARVNGEFQFQIQDWNDMYFEVDIDHFTLTSWQKMSLHLSKATVDLSAHRTPSMPYAFSADKTWEGVYIKQVSITLPQPFKSNCSSYASSGGSNTCRMKVTADHLAVGTVDENEDGHGVFGDFTISGQAPLIGGPIMAGEWGYSMDEIKIRFEANELKKFDFKGEMGVPILSKDGPLKYEAGWQEITNPGGIKEDKYSFEISDQLSNPKKYPIWNVAEIQMDNWAVKVDLVGNDFNASVGFWGSMKIGNVNDYVGNQLGSMVKIPKLEFDNLRLQTYKPYIAVESIRLTEGGSFLSGIPVTIEEPSFTSEEEGCRIGFGVRLNLMSEGSGIDATGFFALDGEYKRDANYNRYWAYKAFVFEGAKVTVDLPQFYAHGDLKTFSDDPTYGNGFYATVFAKIIGKDLKSPSVKGQFQLKMTAMFGGTSGYRYWMVDGFVRSDKLKVPIFPPYYLDGFGGGAFHHMKPASYSGSPDDAPSFAEDNSGLIYKPTRETKLGIKFSTSFSAESGLSTGLLTCIIRFGNNYSLQNITFWGTADFMVESGVGEKILKNVEDAVPDVVKSKGELDESNNAKLYALPQNTIRANIGLSFTFDGPFVFHGFGEMLFNLNNNITGQGTVDILLDTKRKKWHVWIGGYDDGSTKTQGFFDENEMMTLYPITAKIVYEDINLTAKSYFLTGNDIPGPPPLPQEAAAFFADKNPKNNRSLLKCGGKDPALGTGIAFGASAYFKFRRVKIGKFTKCFIGNRVDIGAGIGFDFSLLKYNSTASCGTGGPIGGINGLRATGRVYAFVNIEKGHVLCIPLPKAGVGAMLDFDVPNPSYFKGIIRLKFAGLSGDLSAEWGTKCGTPCNP